MKKNHNIDKQYLSVMKEILQDGYLKNDRTGTNTLSIFGTELKHDMVNGFPLITSKEIYKKGVIEELLWFLKGETNGSDLTKKNVHIWNGDMYKKYCETVKENPLSYEDFVSNLKNSSIFATAWGELGKIYGYQFRNFNGKYDQIAKLIKDLVNNPDSRRLMVTAWNPCDLDECTLPPCHYGFQIYTRELSENERMVLLNHNLYNSKEIKSFDNIIDIPKRAISLKWTQRSADYCLGVPFNIASYGFLLHILGKIVNMYPEHLIGSLGDTHIYTNHIDNAKIQSEIKDLYKLPTLTLNGVFNNVKDYWDKKTFRLDDFLKEIKVEDFVLNNYKSHPKIEYKLSN